MLCRLGNIGGVQMVLCRLGNRRGRSCVVPPWQHRRGTNSVVPHWQHRRGTNCVVPLWQHRRGTNCVVPPGHHRRGRNGGVQCVGLPRVSVAVVDFRGMWHNTRVCHIALWRFTNPPTPTLLISYCMEQGGRFQQFGLKCQGWRPDFGKSRLNIVGLVTSISRLSRWSARLAIRVCGIGRPLLPVT